MDTLNGTYAEYAICPEQTVFRIPDSMSDEEAATMPLTLFTAAVGLYRNLDIPAPWDRSDDRAAGTDKVALVVNGASSAVGAFAIKLARLNSRVRPIIAVAGSSKDFVKSLGVDSVVDYRSESVADDIKKAAGAHPIRYVFDATNTLSSMKYLTSVLEKNGRYTCTMPVKHNSINSGGAGGLMEKILEADDMWYEQIWVGDVHETKKAGGQLFGNIISRTIENALANGQMTVHPYEVVQNGLLGVQAALEELRDRERGGNAKFVTRISDTPSIDSKA